MTVPDKVPYSKAELVAEICSVILSVALGITLIILTVLGINGASSIICGIVIMVVCGAFSVASGYPQYTNMVTEPTAGEQLFHRIRRGCIIAKFVLTAALAVLSLL